MIVAAVLIAIITSGVLAVTAGLAFGAPVWLCLLIYMLSGCVTTLLVTGIFGLCQWVRGPSAAPEPEPDEAEAALVHV
ncbi:hypothetical protein [Epibacterium sp. Ofav1-8]|uniref:hypothetical protein n=1 Tax=Epibacterium sp. Ofav1-8 TaxID=2917735 RepID=UPI001EF687C3|nr:hypothetical protein [Epibacterium sp. Ofav1-8]MCG7624332.1 hypothetical protein [Epibacterium sp. Ofav1-8]